LQRKRHLIAVKKQRYEKTKAEATVFNELMAKRSQEQRDARHAKVMKKRTESAARKLSEKSTAAAPAKPQAKAPVAVAAKPTKATKTTDNKVKHTDKVASKPAPKK